MEIPLSKNVQIIVDKRERHGPLIYMENAVRDDNAKHKEPIEWCERQITTGDFIVTSNEQIKVIIERKTWEDLAGSIKDQRINSQIDKMMALQQQTNAKIILIVEGHYRKFEHKQHVTYEALQSKIRHMALKSIPCMRTIDSAETAKMVVDFARDIARHYDTHITEEQPHIVSGSHEYLLQQTQMISNTQLQTQMWASIPGVGEKTSHILMDRTTVGNYMRLKREEAKTFCNSLEKEVSAKVLQHIRLLRYAGDNVVFKATRDEMWVGILSQVHSVSKNTATNIVAKLKLWEISSATLETLASVVVSEKRTVGKKLAQRIIDSLYSA